MTNATDAPADVVTVTYQRTINGRGDTRLVTDEVPYPYYLRDDDTWAEFVSECEPRTEPCDECDACEHGYMCHSPRHYGTRGIVARDITGARVFYVNVHEIDRAFGGREEGGWWYDCGTAVATVAVTSRAQARAAYARLVTDYPPQTAREVGSVIYDGGAYNVTVSDEPARDYPDATPRYE
jgi:hypothetical protein